MSSKSTIFLTKDNEHCYFEHNEPVHDKQGKFLGWKIEMEMDYENIGIVWDDADKLIIEFKDPESEIYKRILQTREP